MARSSKRTKKRHPPAKPEQRRQVELQQFTSLDDALKKVEPGSRYIDVGRVIIPIGNNMPLTYQVMFWLSMIARSEGLHRAIAREIRQTNPHAAFPLIRAFAEAVILTIYVSDHPNYVHALTIRPSEREPHDPKRRTIQALIGHASKMAPGVKEVYAELSEATHFGAVAMWTPFVLGDHSDAGYGVSWASSPSWRSDEEALIACAHTIELADAMQDVLSVFARRHIVPLADSTKPQPSSAE